MVDRFEPPAPGDSPLEQAGATLTAEPSAPSVSGFDWADAERRLNRGEQVMMPDGSMKSYVMTPDLYRDLGGTETTTGKYSVNYLPAPEWNMTLPEGEYDRLSDQLSSMFTELEKTSPRTVKVLVENPQLLFIVPELAAQYESKLEGWGPAEQVVDFLTTDLDLKNYEDLRNQAPAVQSFFTNFAPNFSDEELDLLSTVLGVTDGRTRENVAALASRWLDRGPGEENPDLSDPNVKAEFLIWFYEMGRKEETRLIQESAGFGKMSVLDRPRLAITNFVADKWNWATSIGDPSQYAARQGLTMGQQFAFSMGLDPSESGWDWTSGTFDAVGAVALDPTNLLFGLGVANKLKKTVAVTDDIVALGRLGRLGKATQAAIPFYGRSAVKDTMPRFSRAPSTRFFFTMFGKGVDDLILDAGKKGMFTDMHALLAKEGLTGLAETYPAFSHAVDTGGALMEAAKTPDELQEVVRYMMRGSFLDDTTDAFGEAIQQNQKILDNYRDEIVRKVESGEVSLWQLDGVLDDFNVSAGAFAGKVNGVMTKTELNGSKGGRIMLRGNVKVKNILEDGSFARFTVWARRAGPRVSQTFAGLSDEASQAVAAASKLTDDAVRAAATAERGAENTIELMTTLKNAGVGNVVSTVSHNDATYSVLRISDGGTRGYALVDESGQIVTGMMADIAEGGSHTQTAEAFLRQGLNSRLMQAIYERDPAEYNRILNARLADPSKTEAGLRSIRSMAKRTTRDGYARLVDSTVFKLQVGDFESLTPNEIALIRRFGKALGGDIIAFGDNTAAAHILTDRGMNKAVVGIDGPSRDPAYRGALDLASEAIRSDSIIKGLKAGGDRSLVIKDLPIRNLPVLF